MSTVVLHGPSFDPALPQVTPEEVAAAVNAVIPPMVKGQVVPANGSVSQSLFMGMNAGAAFDTTSITDSYGSVGVGAGALQSLTASGAENVAVGTWAAQYLTTGNLATIVGMHAAGHETIAPGLTAIGNDALRNTVSASYVTAVGQGTILNGNPSNGTTALGSQALWGHSTCIILSGTKTTGDVLTLALASANPDVTPASLALHYTVLAGDTMLSIANALAGLLHGAMNGPSNLLQAVVGTLPDGTIALSMVFPGSRTTGWLVTITPSTSGGATEVMTIRDAGTGNNITAVGNFALHCPAMNNPSNLTAVGAHAGQSITSGSFNSIFGAQTGQFLMTGSNNAYFGEQTANNIITGNNNTFLGSLNARNATAGGNLTIVGANAGNKLSATPTNVTMLGEGVGGATLATGTDVILIGSGAGVVDTPLAATSHFINIQNILTVTGTDVPATSLAVLAGGLGVWGHAAPAAKPATPVTLADVISVLQQYGLVA